MNHNRPDNDGYGVKRGKHSGGKGSTNGKSAYEIRTDLLKLAFELHRANVRDVSDPDIKVEDVVKTATAFNDFISKRSDS